MMNSHEEELRQLNELKTPHMVQNDNQNYHKDISPTKPLQFKPKEEFNSLKFGSPRLQSEESISSHLTQSTDHSISSYETAMDYQQQQHYQELGQLPKSSSASSSSSSQFSSRGYVDHSTDTILKKPTVGLGIEDLNIRDPPINSIHHTFSSDENRSTTSSHYFNDEATPKVDDFSFDAQSPQPNNSFEQPSITIDHDSYNDDPTPKVEEYRFNQQPQQSQQPQSQLPIESDPIPKLTTPKVFHPAHHSISYNVTPVLEPQARLESGPSLLKGEGDASSVYNDTDAQIEKVNAVEVKPMKTSPKKTPSINRARSISTRKTADSPSTNNTSNNGSQDQSFNYSFNDTTYSHESTYLNDLKKEKHNTTNLLSGGLGSDGAEGSQKNISQEERKSLRFSTITPADEELVSLFLCALHGFDANSLELTSDSAICLSFEKNDVVFVHSVDSSGWGEVTMIKNFKRGWVPVNYFTELITPANIKTSSISKSKAPLKFLLISSAKFLRNPAEESDEGFSIYQINDIRDGVRYLLEQTDCLSRSTDIVKKKPIIRRIRKSLLADWYSLMIKADSYKNSATVVHIETLQLMILQVIRKSLAFLEIWGIENDLLQKENKERSMKAKSEKKSNIPYLGEQPYAKERLNEIHNLLFTYIGLVLGRLDMIEHNPSGCQLLENLIHQMILLLREILFISKSCVLILNNRNRKIETKFDDNLDTLLSLVSELVSSVKMFVTKTIHEDYGGNNLKVNDGLYYYSPEGDDLIGIVSRMTRSISASIENCYRYIILIGDFRLGEEKKFPDFQAIKITPEDFIRTCSVGLIKTFNKKQVDLKGIKRNNVKRQSRYSMVRSGLNNEMGLTSSGTNLLQEFLPDSKSFVRNSVFEPYLNESNEDIDIQYDAKSEIVYDSNGKLLGASFRGLVYLLTDELNKPDQFLVSSFFLTFKLYGDGVELIEELISRFNVDNKFDAYDDYDETGEYSSYESRLKNRRRIICKMFQIWLQSYWDYRNDYNLLPTLINFFNESVSQFLPIESKKLIELCSKLTGLTPSKIKASPTVTTITPILANSSSSATIANGSIQLVKRSMGLSKHSSVISNSSSVPSIVSINDDLDNDDYIFEEYELAKMNNSNRNSILLPLPGISFNNNSLLSRSQIHEIENLVLQYRRFLGTTLWEHNDYTHYYPIDVNALFDKWYTACQTTLTQSIDIEQNLVEINSFEFAKQLTLIESRIFLSIKSEELLGGNFASKKSKMNLSPNISRSLLFTNLLSEYVLDSILTPGLTLKKRVLRFKNWLNVGLSCYYLKNFNSLAAIIISLQNHMVSRLDDIWNGLPDKYQNLYKDLMKIIHPDNNYKGYRYKISKILDESDNKSSIPLVPYINLFLQDLTFIDEGNRDFRNSNSFLRSKIINIDKFLKISKIVSNMEFLQVGYDSAGIGKKSSKRNSIFSFNSGSSLNDNVSPVLPLQEFILLEFWRVHQINMKNDDRYWILSKQLKQ